MTHKASLDLFFLRHSDCVYRWTSRAVSMPPFQHFSQTILEFESIRSVIISYLPYAPNNCLLTPNTYYKILIEIHERGFQSILKLFNVFSENGYELISVEFNSLPPSLYRLPIPTDVSDSLHPSQSACMNTCLCGPILSCS